MAIIERLQKQILELEKRNQVLLTKIIELEEKLIQKNQTVAAAQPEKTVEKPMPSVESTNIQSTFQPPAKVESQQKSTEPQFSSNLFIRKDTTRARPSITYRSVEKGKITVSNKEFERARTLFDRGEYRQAIDAFTAILKVGIEETMRDDCDYWIGECNFELEKYLDAVRQFRLVVAYPISEWKSAALLTMGKSLEKLGRNAEAKEVYQTIVMKYKGTIECSIAARMMKRTLSGLFP